VIHFDTNAAFVACGINFPYAKGCRNGQNLGGFLAGLEEQIPIRS
jgi:hypothetical protein